MYKNVLNITYITGTFGEQNQFRLCCKRGLILVLFCPTENCCKMLRTGGDTLVTMVYWTDFKYRSENGILFKLMLSLFRVTSEVQLGVV